MVEPPRGRPSTQAERLRVLATRMPGGSDVGGTRNAKPIPANVRAAGRKLQPPAGGGPVGAVSYAALTPLSSDDYFDPSTLVATTGDVSVMVYDGSDPGIRIDGEGWYQAEASAAIQSGTVSSSMALILAVGGGVANPGSAVAHLPADYARNTVSVALLPFFIPAAHLPAFVDFRVQGVSGFTVAGNIWVVKLT